LLFDGLSLPVKVMDFYHEWLAQGKVEKTLGGECVTPWYVGLAQRNPTPLVRAGLVALTRAMLNFAHDYAC
jgi:hypothetical protein